MDRRDAERERKDIYCLLISSRQIFHIVVCSLLLISCLMLWGQGFKWRILHFDVTSESSPFGFVQFVKLSQVIGLC